MKFFSVLLFIFAIFSVTSAIPIDAPVENQTEPVGPLPPCCKKLPNNTFPSQSSTQSSMTAVLPPGVAISPPRTDCYAVCNGLPSIAKSNITCHCPMKPVQAPTLTSTTPPNPTESIDPRNSGNDEIIYENNGVEIIEDINVIEEDGSEYDEDNQGNDQENDLGNDQDSGRWQNSDNLENSEDSDDAGNSSDSGISNDSEDAYSYDDPSTDSTDSFDTNYFNDIE